MKKQKNEQPRSPRPSRKKWVLPLSLAVLTAAIAAILFLPSARARVAGLYNDTKSTVTAIRERAPRQRPDMATAGFDVTLKIQNALVARFTEIEMRESDYTIQYFPKDSTIEIRASVPRGRPMEWIIWKLSAAAAAPFGVEDAVCIPETRCVVTFRSSDVRHPKIVLRVQQSSRYFSNTARMAILVENFGFEANQTAVEYLSFPEPLTFSIIPTEKSATLTAQVAGEHKKEVVLLLPMEPLPDHLAQHRRSMIMIHHSESQIRNMFAQAAAAVPNFSGVTNLHGRSVMEDSRAMEIILSEINRRRAYFVYTDISRKSVAPQLTRTMKTSSMQIQTSIDANHTPEQARERIRRAAIAAERTGRHLLRTQPSAAFIQALKEENETLRRNGIRLVYVSELVK
jgi:polysaccharide deacetylase 2 family uncharacterized protein YibQ